MVKNLKTEANVIDQPEESRSKEIVNHAPSTQYKSRATYGQYVWRMGGAEFNLIQMFRQRLDLDLKREYRFITL